MFPKSSVVDPLVIYFPHGPQNGIFCSLITFLLSNENRSPFAWELHLASQSPTCLYQNSVKFVIPKHPGSITLIDSFTQFEAHINTPSTKICGFVRNAIFEGLGRASRILNYNNSTPQPAFLCPCKEGSTHAATVGADETFWICSQNAEKWGQLQDKQRMWLQSAKPAQPLASEFSFFYCLNLYFCLSHLLYPLSSFHLLILSISAVSGSSLSPSSGVSVGATCTRTEPALGEIGITHVESDMSVLLGHAK